MPSLLQGLPQQEASILVLRQLWVQVLNLGALVVIRFLP